MRTLGILAAVAVLATGGAQAAPAKVTPQGPAVQQGADAFVIRSEHTGRDYLVEVTAPMVTATVPGQKLPAVVALDDGYGVVGPQGRMLVQLAAMEAAYMVTVGYPRDKPNMRAVDLTHQPYVRDDGKPGGGGGGAAFQAFLTEELAPFLAERYPIDRGRLVLFGHSLGGLFAANVLASRPDAFAGYIIGSPSVQRDPSVVDKVAAAAPRGAGRSVIVAVGGKEPDYMLAGAKKIADALSGAGSTFKVSHRVYADDTHLSYYPAFSLVAMPQALPRSQPIPDQTRPIQLDPASLARYAGVYRLADGKTVVASVKDGRLWGQMTGAPLVELTPQSETRFFVRGVDVQVTFELAGPGPAKALLIRLNGAEARAVRAD